MSSNLSTGFTLPPAHPEPPPAPVPPAPATRPGQDQPADKFASLTPAPRIPSRLFCWSGGGMTGLDIHAGLALALEEHGLVPDANAGTSAGAVFAAWHSLGLSALDLARIVADLQDKDVRAERTLWKLRIPWLDHFLSAAPILGLLQTWLPDHGFGSKPLAIMATNALTGAPVNVARPELAESLPHAVSASMAIAGVFPRVRLLDGHDYVDGGCREYLPLPADWCEYDEVYILVAQTCPADYRKTSGILTALISNASWLLVDQVEDTIWRAQADAGEMKTKLIVLRPELRSSTGALRFDHRLIEEAHDYARRALE